MVRMYNGVSSFFRPHHNRKIIQYSKIRQSNHNFLDILDTAWYLSFDSEQISTKMNLVNENYFEGLLIFILKARLRLSCILSAVKSYTCGKQPFSERNLKYWPEGSMNVFCKTFKLT